MKAALLLCALLLAAAGPASALKWSELSLLDPSSWVDLLSGQASNAPSKGKWTPPEFCGNSECPPFKVEKSYDNYEIRTYEKGKWAATRVNETKYELAYTKASARLMAYFKGKNDNSTHMDLTTPTLARLKPSEDTKETERDYDFSYWLPEEFQKDSPKPTDKDVRVKRYGKATVFVRNFTGFATEGTILDNAHALHEMLKEDDQDFDEESIFVAVYDPPQKLLNRHNEVHVPVASKSWMSKQPRARPQQPQQRSES